MALCMATVYLYGISRTEAFRRQQEGTLTCEEADESWEQTLERVPCVDISRLGRDTNAHISVFSPANIRVIPKIVYFDAPDIVATNLDAWAAYDSSALGLPLTDAGKAVTNAIAAVEPSMPQHPCVIYVPVLRHIWYGTTHTNDYGQRAPYYGNTAFIPAGTEDPFTPAHETVHIMFDSAIFSGGDDHDEAKWNLMCNDIIVYGNTTATGPKRLKKDQIKKMQTLGSKYLK